MFLKIRTIKKVAVSINFIEHHSIIEIKYLGKISQDDFIFSFLRSNLLTIENGVFNIIADCTDMLVGNILNALYDYLSFFEQYYNRFSLKEAIIIPSFEKIKNHIESFEMACLNRGFKVRLFEKEENAIKWLKT